MKRYAKKWCRRFPLLGAIFCIVCLFSLAIKLNFDIINHSDRSTLDEAIITKKIKAAYTAYKPLPTGSFVNKFDKIINYPPFVIRKPKFIDKKDEKLFLNIDLNIQALQDVSESRLKGRIVFQKNATIHESYDCGWKTNLNEFQIKRKSSRRVKELETATGLLVPQSDSFQHFMDGVLPKIIQECHLEIVNHYIIYVSKQ